MPGFHSRLFTRIISRNKEVYVLKIITLAISFASSILILLFSFNEFSYDRLAHDPYSIFRILQRNQDEEYSGNRLSTKIPTDVINHIQHALPDSLLISKVKIMNEVSVQLGNKNFFDQKIHAVDTEIKSIFSFNIIDGDAMDFIVSASPVVMLSSQAATTYTGSRQAAGKKIRLYTFGDTIEAKIAAVFEDFPKNTHDDFNLLMVFDPAAISTLNFDPEETSLYGKLLKGTPNYLATSINRPFATTNFVYRLQPLPSLYFGPRVLGEEARHGDSYSIIILLSIAGLIFFLALTNFINLTTLTLPYRSKELAVKKLAGVSQKTLLLTFLKESFSIVGISLVIGLSILISISHVIEPILGLNITTLLLHADARLMLIVLTLSLILSIAPVFLTVKFIRASPNRLLSTDIITFPKFKRVITVLQLGISIFLIIVSVVVRRQINYSLLKEPGRNHDQVVYLNSPQGITNAGIRELRYRWRNNPNILDVMAVSQLPDRISSKEIGSKYYSLLVDHGFRSFFGLQMKMGRWFRVNDGDSLIVLNKIGETIMSAKNPLVIGVIQDLSGQFNQPELPVKIKLGPDYNYNWLCVRILEVDIRKTVDYLSGEFSIEGQKANVHYLNKHFASWINYQDRLNLLSEILAVISALLSCCAIYGLSVSLVRDKLKQIAVHKLYGAHTASITRLLAKEFAVQMLVALIIFGPITYIFLNELLRNFVYATKFNWLDPVYPIAYCAFVIVTLCGFQAMSLNRADLTSALKG